MLEKNQLPTSDNQYTHLLPKPIVIILVFLLFALAAVGIYMYWMSNSRFESSVADSTTSTTGQIAESATPSAQTSFFSRSANVVSNSIKRITRRGNSQQPSQDTTEGTTGSNQNQQFVQNGRAVQQNGTSITPIATQIERHDQLITQLQRRVEELTGRPIDEDLEDDIAASELSPFDAYQNLVNNNRINGTASTNLLTRSTLLSLFLDTDTELGDLSDVNLTSTQTRTTNVVLTWNGTEWVDQVINHPSTDAGDGLNKSGDTIALGGDFDSDIELDLDGNIFRIKDGDIQLAAKFIDNLLPNSDNTHSLGSSSLAWKNIYGTTIYQDGNQVCDTSGNCSNSGNFDGSGTANYLALWSDSDTFTTSTIYDDGTNIGIGTTNPSSFKLQLSGNIGPTTDSSSNLGSASLAWANVYADTFTQNGNSVCDNSGNCSGLGNLWSESTGALSPVNNSLDLLVGNSATTSAKFAFINVDSGTPTASIAGSTINVATTLTGEGTLGTTNMQDLTLGNASTGNLSLAPAGSAAMTINQSGSVGIGTTDPSRALDVIGSVGISSGNDLYIAGTGLSTTSGAGLVGANTSGFSHSSSNDVQSVLSDLDSAITAAASYYDIVVAKDGSGDHTTIAAALSAASSGDSIFIGPGTYSENLSFSTTNLTLIGAGRDATIISGSTGSPTLAITDADEVRLANFSITNSGSSSGDDVIDNTSGNTFDHVYYNLEISGGYRGIDADFADNLIVSNSYIHSTTERGIYLIRSDQSTITDNTFTSNDIAVRVYVSTGVIVTNNQISATTNSGIYMDNAHESVINNNYLDNTGSHSIYYDQTNGAVINGNSINDSGGHGIVTANFTKRITITSNHIDNATNDGISAAGSATEDITVADNSINSSGGDGIDAGGTSSVRINITNNKLIGNAAYGIEIDSSLTEALITDNYFHNNTSGSTNTSGDKTKNIMLGLNKSTARDLDLMNLHYYPETGNTFGQNLLSLTMDGADASSFTGNGLEITVDASQNTGTPLLIQDDGDTAQFSVSENGTVYSAGNIGIGTTNPSNFELQIAGSIGPQSNDTYDLGSSANRFSEGYFGTQVYTPYVTSDNADLTLYTTDQTNGDIKLVPTYGNIGIGVVNPESYLHVAASSTGKALVTLDETGDQAILTASSSGTPRFTINNDGNVGIGTTSTSNAHLEIDPGSQRAIYALGSSNSISVITGATSGNGIGVYGSSSGSGIGVQAISSSGKALYAKNTDTTYAGHIERNEAGDVQIARFQSAAGSAYITHDSFDPSSDRRLKENIRDTDALLDKVMALRPVNYNLKADENHTNKYGFIAQEAEPLFPELVGYGSDGMRTFSYGRLTPILTKAIQEQQLRINEVGELVSETQTSATTTQQSQQVLGASITKLESQVSSLLSQQQLFTKIFKIIKNSAGKAQQLVLQLPTVFEKTVTFLNPLTLNQDSAGSIELPAGATQTTVTFAEEFAQTPQVFLSFDGAGADYQLEDISKTGFTILFDETVAETTVVRWLAVMTDEDTDTPAIDVETTELEKKAGSSDDTSSDPTPSPEPSPTPTPTPSPSPSATSSASETATESADVEVEDAATDSATTASASAN